MHFKCLLTVRDCTNCEKYLLLRHRLATLLVAVADCNEAALNGSKFGAQASDLRWLRCLASTERGPSFACLLIKSFQKRNAKDRLENAAFRMQTTRAMPNELAEPLGTSWNLLELV